MYSLFYLLVHFFCVSVGFIVSSIEMFYQGLTLTLVLLFWASTVELSMFF